ncbi:MAG: cytochrome c-type biogenesis protein CcmH [Caldilineaceae bacterium]|nr:cytochrome c-type biogenesis protein CcmH [Caldilineaceae bacterium]
MSQFLAFFRNRFLWTPVAVLIITLLGGLFLPMNLLAQESTPAPAPSREVTADEVNVVARELWCPLCSGVRLDSCELKACDQMRDVIALKLAEGEDTESIRTYFVAQYGPQVLGEPPLEGFNWLAWVLPFVVLAAGGYFLWQTLRWMVQPAAVAPANSPGQSSPTPSSPIPSSPTPSSPSSSSLSTERSDDDYSSKLAEELKRYG